MMVLALERPVEGDISMQLEGESYLEKMAQWLWNLFKFKNFYDQSDFSLEQRPTRAKANNIEGHH